MAELKSCPFCGGEAKLVKRKFKTGFYPSGGTYYVHCKVCLITTQPRKKAEDAVEVWNRRTPQKEGVRMTDNEIIKALECCEGTLAGCEECPNYRRCTIKQDALTLIKRQQAEINQFADIGKMYSEIKAEVVKAFAEKIKAQDGNAFITEWYESADICYEFDNEAYGKFIDSLVQEFTEITK